jgi:hypothetical protein
MSPTAVAEAAVSDMLSKEWKTWDQQIAQVDEKSCRTSQSRRARRDLQRDTNSDDRSWCQPLQSLDVVEPHWSYRTFPASPKPGELFQPDAQMPQLRKCSGPTGSITKEGSKIARFILGQLALQFLKGDPKMRAWYRRIKVRRGSKIARVVVMRRITTILATC